MSPKPPLRRENGSGLVTSTNDLLQPNPGSHEESLIGSGPGNPERHTLVAIAMVDGTFNRVIQFTDERSPV